MKKFLLIIILSLLCIVNVDAIFMDSKATSYTYPNGEEVIVYTTGDEYFRYTHDKYKNVIILNENGYYAYAKKENDKVVASDIIYDGINIPSSTIKRSDLTLNNTEVNHEFNTPSIPTISLFSGRYQANGSGNDVLNFNNTVIFIRFSDEEEFVNEEFMEKIVSLFGTSNSDTSSLKSYVNQISNGKVNAGSTFLQYDGNNYYSYQSKYSRNYLTPYSTTNTIGYSTTSESEKRLHEILLSALYELEETDKGNVDANNDGYMDNIIFIISGSSSSNWGDILWPHQWYLSPYYNISSFSEAMPYIYNLQFANDLELSVLSHETMHSLGIPDLYRYSYNGDPVGKWDMMNHHNEGTYITSIVRNMYGKTASTSINWSEPSYIEESGIYELDLASTNSNNTSYLVATSDEKQYIQLEYRGNNSNNIFDKYVPGKGLIVSRINHNYSDNMGTLVNGSYVDGDLYYIFRPGESSDKYGLLGGGGNLANAAITPCTTSLCDNEMGSKDESATLYTGALTLENGTNTKIYIKNVIAVDDDTIQFELFTSDEEMYLNHKSYEGIPGDTFNLTPTCWSDSCTDTTYSSSNEAVATVDNDGNVSIVGTGTAEIIVTAQNTTKTCTIASGNATIDNIDTSIIDAHNIQIDVNVSGTADSVKIYRYLDGDEGNITLIAENLIPNADGKVTYVDEIGSNNFGNTYVYQASTVEGNVIKISNLTSKINTKDYLPSQVTNLNVNMTNIDKINVSFNSVEGADGYNIYISDNVLGPYTLITSTTNTSYDFNGEFGQTYYFKVAAYKITDDLKYEGIESDITGINTNNYLLDAPSNLDITTLSNTSIKLVFDKVENATQYNIYRSTDKKNYKKVATVNDLEYIDNNVSVGKTYYYKVSAIKDDLYDGYKSNAISITIKSTAPTNLVITNYSYSSLKITFDKLNDIDGYQIYYSTSKNGTYKKLATITTNSYTHKSLKFNKYYYYKVRSYKKVNGKTTYSNFSLISGKKVVTSAPTVTFTPLSTNSVKLSWKKVTGATSYKVYYSTEYNGTYKLLKTVSTNTYTHKNLIFGSTYYYKVISYRNSTKGDSKIVEYQVIPNSPTITYSNNMITNSTVNNIDGYEVFRSINDGEYISIGSPIDNKYQVESSSDLVKYYVVAYKNLNGDKIYSRPSNYVSNIKDILVSDYTFKSTGAKNVLVNVSSNEYVDGYYLYMATSKNGTYKKVATSKTNEITYSSLTPGKTYYFKVRPYVTLNGTNYLGTYSEIKSYKHVINTTDIKLSNYTYNSVKINWTKISGAKGYQIRYKKGINGTYKSITTTSNSYIHKNLTLNSEYYYQVRSYITANGKKIYSAYSEEKSIKITLPAPTFTVENNKLGIINITINKISGADKYIVYISNDGINYTPVETTARTFTYEGCELDQTYYFKVSAVKNNVEGLISAEQRITTVVPKVQNFNIVASTTKSGATNITWDLVDNIDGYVLFLEDIPIYIGTNVNYIDKDLILGKNYNYSIKAYKTINGQTYYSQPSYFEIKLQPLKVNNVTITSSMKDSSLTFTFDELDDVDGYKILRSTSSNGTYKEIKKCSSNSCTIYNITPGTYYYYKVVGYATFNNQEIDGINSDIKKYKFVPEQVTNAKATSSGNTSIKISWDKMPNVKGYEVYRSTSKTGKYSLIKTTTSTSFTNTSRTTGKTYYYKVRSYILVNGKKVYSPFSAITSTYARPKTVTNLKVARYNYSSTQNKISWSTLSGVTGYAVYRSKDGVNYTRIAYTTKNYYIDKGASNSAKNFYKVRAYKTVSSKKILGNYSDSILMLVPDEPSLQYWITDEYNSDASGVFFSINNLGGKQLTLLSSGAHFVDDDFASFDRTAKLIDTNDLLNYNRITYLSKLVVPGNTQAIIAYVFPTSTWYDEYSRLYFYFIYDGVKYGAFVSHYYGFYYWEA